jgi:erythromycin esterase-like protein
MKHLFCTILTVLSLFINISHAQEVVNGSFELKSAKSISRGWTTSSQSPAYRIRLDSGNAHSGKYALKFDAADTAKPSSAIAYSSYGRTSVKPISTIEITGRIKIAHAADSAIGFFIQSMSGRKIFTGFAKTDQSQINRWQWVTVKHAVEAGKPWAGFYYGITFNKPAVAWADDVTVKVDGKLIADPESLYKEPTAGNINWLNQHLSPLTSASIQPQHTDMAPIGKFCADATVVGIGEPTHGTHEALQFKLRLLEYLVTKKGFNTIALEEVIPTCDKMNDLLNNQPGAIKDSLLNMPFYKLWKTAEMYELFAWISRYNRTHTRKVKLIGIDMEDIRIRTSRQMIGAFGRRHNGAISNEITVIDRKLDTLFAANPPKYKPTDIQVLANDVKAELCKLESLVNIKNSTTNAEQLFTLKTYVRVCQQWLDTRFFNQAVDARDQYMAQNVKFYAAHHPADKVLIWAHNFHVANYSENGTKQMGAYLKRYFGKKYLAVSFTSASGSYTAAQDYTQKVWKAYPFESAYRGTYAYVLGKAKSNLYFLPLNIDAAKQKDAAWLNLPMKQFDIPYIQSGGEEDYKYYSSMSTAFDGVVFCKTTTGSLSYLALK